METTYMLNTLVGGMVITTAFESEFLATRARTRALANGATQATIVPETRSPRTFEIGRRPGVHCGAVSA